MTLEDYQDEVQNAMDADYDSVDDLMDVYQKLQDDLADLEATDGVSDDDKATAESLLSDFEEKFNLDDDDDAEDSE